MKKVIAFVKKHPEILAIPVGLIVWKISIYILRILDPTTGVYDAGIFQIPIFAVIEAFIYISIAWLILKLIFGTVRRYIQGDFKKDFSELDVWKKIRFSYAIFFAILFLL